MRIKNSIILATSRQYKFLENELCRIGSPSLNLAYPPLADLGIQDILYFKGLPFIKIEIEKIRKKFKIIDIKHLGNNFNKWRLAIYNS